MSRPKSSSQHSIPSLLVSDGEELTDEELLKEVNHLKQDIRKLRIENEVLEKMMARVDPNLLVGIQQTLEYALKVRAQSNSNFHLSSFAKSSSKIFHENTLASPSRSLFSNSRIFAKRVESTAKMTSTFLLSQGPKINLMERSEIVSTEMELILKGLAKEVKKADKQQAFLNAQLEEISLRENDIKKAVDMFHEGVIVQGWDKIAQRIPAEVWVRFMREWDKITDTVIGKLRLRTSTLNTQYSKLKSQIKAKEELSESLRPVDFDQLKIQNYDINKQIDEKLIHLAELKQLTGEANLNLTVHKKALFAQNDVLVSIQKSIKEKELQTVALQKERGVIQEQVERLAVQLDAVKSLRQAYNVPDVLEYVNVKADVTDLTHNIKVLENRVRIHQIALASINRKLRNMVLNEVGL